jgi:glycosyltransferase involved in cell wall biosynthesis
VRVLIDTTYALRGPSGTATYVRHLVPALRALGVDVVEAANEHRRPPGRGGVGSVRNLAGDRLWVERGLRRRGVDLVHHPLPAHATTLRVPQVVTVHDLAFERVPECFDARFRRWAHRAHRRAARRAAAVVAVSEATALDARELWGVDAIVARHGPGLEVRVRAEPRHLLYVGDDEPRKQLDVLLAAHRRYREAGGTLGLVLAGSVRADEPGVEVVHRPSQRRLAGLYAHAAALVHPARCEGFGMTVLDALAAGVPVIAARCPAIEELCGRAATFVAPGDVDGLAAAMAGPRDGSRGPERAAHYSWERSARAHIEAYTLALGR